MEIAPHITINPDVHHEAPVITGTDLLVADILRTLSQGKTQQEVMTHYQLSSEQIEAIFAYAAGLVDQTTSKSFSDISARIDG